MFHPLNVRILKFYRNFGLTLFSYKKREEKIENTPSYNFINKMRGDEATLGGGISIGIDK